MQKAKTVLAILSEKSKKDENYVFQRLYRNLFCIDLYMLAYARIYKNEGNMTPGVDEQTIDGFSKDRVYKIIERMKTETYYPKAVRRSYIPKKGGKRALGISSFDDKLVQEVLRQIIEAIYEPLFSDCSHGFRPNRSCQTALHQIKSKCKGTNWVIEGDIEKFYDTISIEILLDLLRRKIDDGRLIELIRRFLKAGYFESKQVRNSLSGVPQGSIVSPVLSNVYLHEFDKFMERLMESYNKGKTRKRNPVYRNLYGKRSRARQKGDHELAKMYLKKMRQVPSLDPMDPNFIRVKYTRYADDFATFVIGSKHLAEEIKSVIAEFLEKELKLRLNLQKTLITNLGDKHVRFLGYEIAKTRNNTYIKENSLGYKKRSINDTIQLLVPADAITKRLEPFTRNRKSVHHNARINDPILDLIAAYNSEIRGLYNYYSLATDVSTKVGKFKFYHYYSLIKTIARKEKSSAKKVIDKYGIEVKRKNGTGTRRVVGITYETKNGSRTQTYFNDSLVKKDEPSKTVSDKLEIRIPHRCQLIDRLNANECELCGKQGQSNEFEVHHVRKLKDVKRKYAKRGKDAPEWVLRMSRMNRKTLIVCKDCHNRIHSGKQDKEIHT